MFSNQFLKFSLQQQTEDNEIGQNQQMNTDNQVDFTFDNYISKDEDLIKKGKFSDKFLQSDQYSPQTQMTQPNQKSQENSQLSVLKNHILNIESIAIRQIQALKEELERQKSQKIQLKYQVQYLQQKLENQQDAQKNEERVNLLKEQNRMLKEALKKQLQINKNLLKTSIREVPPSESITQTKNMNQQEDDFNKQNNQALITLNQSQNLNSKLKIISYDRPIVPLPSQTKRTIRG